MHDNNEATGIQYVGLQGIDKLELPAKTIGFLKSSGIRTLEQLKKMKRKDLLGVRGIGPKTFDNIIEAYIDWLVDRPIKIRRKGKGYLVTFKLRDGKRGTVKLKNSQDLLHMRINACEILSKGRI